MDLGVQGAAPGVQGLDQGALGVDLGALGVDLGGWGADLGGHVMCTAWMRPMLAALRGDGCALCVMWARLCGETMKAAGPRRPLSSIQLYPSGLPSGQLPTHRPWRPLCYSFRPPQPNKSKDDEF